MIGGCSVFFNNRRMCILEMIELGEVVIVWDYWGDFCSC